MRKKQLFYKEDAENIKQIDLYKIKRHNREMSSRKK
jgi:hypothetical protein